jgi:iron complex outermembrane receptor protein
MVNTMKILFRTTPYNVLTGILYSSIFSLSVAAQEVVNIQKEAVQKESIEKIVVTGSRRTGEATNKFPSPVDIIGVKTLQSQANIDLSDILRTVVPSFNITSHPISGTSSLVRPANLRGMGADHTLVLVNGKRRHRAANIPNFSGGINDGTQGTDISSIPLIALKSVEVLRDGASAQYGADAIAGVLNFVANNEPTTRSIELKTAQHYKGDGQSIYIAGTYGIEIFSGGSLNFSGEFTESDKTNRSQQNNTGKAFSDAGYPVRDPAIFWGNSEIKDDIKLFVNLVMPVLNTSEIYGFGQYSTKENISGFFYRQPSREGVFALGDERLVFDTTQGGNSGNGSGNCPDLTVPDLTDAAAVSADFTAIENLRTNPNCFSFLEDFPGGTAPWFSGISNDYSGSIGFRGELSEDMNFDLSVTFGQNELNYSTFDNFNPTFGSQSPNELDVGSRTQQEQTINADLIKVVDVGFASDLNIAFGVEWHRESYKQKPGQKESWDIGPYTTSSQGTQGISVGTLGFGAFNPSTSFSGSRNNIAIYTDVETDITNEWTLGFAIRYEDFDNLGDDTNFKLATLYRLTDSFSMRSTLSTGFHAPTPGQQLFAQSTVGFDSNGVLTTTSTLPANVVSKLPSFDTVNDLAAEEATNFGFGLIWDSTVFKLTLDYFRINVDNRITLTSTFAINDADRDALQSVGFLNASQFTAINYFTNDFDTQTQGIDIVGSMELELLDRGISRVLLSYNHTDTKVIHQGQDLSDLRVLQLEQQLPKDKAILTFTHAVGDFSGVLRVNYYGALDEYYLSTTRHTELDAQVTIGFELSYLLTHELMLSIGGQNIFDSYPTKAVYAEAFGSTYPVSSPAGSGGGLYYAKIKYSF